MTEADIFVVKNNNAEMLFTIKPDGTIIRGEAFTTNDEMSLKFWESVNSIKKHYQEQ